LEEDLDRTKYIFYDPNRSFYLAKIHDGEGNIYVFNCPHDITLKMKDVLKRGELISFRLKGKTSKKMDSSSDLFARSYNKILPLEFKDSKMEQDEFVELLTESKKHAPIPGRETKHAPPVFVAPEITDIPTPATNEHGKIIGRFRGQDLYRPNPRYSPYALIDKECRGCQAPIHGKLTVSSNTNGSYSRFQAFTPFEAAKQEKPGGHHWLCVKCANQPPEQAQPETASTPDVETPAIETLQPPTSAPDEIILGPNYFKFERYGEDFFYKGAKIFKTSTGYHTRRTVACSECGGPIELDATATFKDGKPHCMSAQKAVVKGFAVPIKPKSKYWKHVDCQDNIPEPAPPETPQPPPALKTLKIPMKTSQPPDITRLDSSAVLLGLINRLEEMSKDESLEDKAFRGAAWMLCRYATTRGESA